MPGALKSLLEPDDLLSITLENLVLSSKLLSQEEGKQFTIARA